MRTIIAGSREIVDIALLRTAILKHQLTITSVISGTARGVDRLGEQWAKENDIPITKYPAQWDLHGKSAGYRRNIDMANVAEQVLILWNGSSVGTKHMVDISRRLQLPLYIEYCQAIESGES